MFKENRGNTSKGEKHYLSKVSLKQVKEIRKSFKIKQRELAKKYNLDQSAISRIINNKIYVI